MSDFGGGELIPLAVETWEITIISLLPAGFPSARAFIQSKMHWSLTGYFKQWKGVVWGWWQFFLGMRSFWRKEDMIDYPLTPHGTGEKLKVFKVKGSLDYHTSLQPKLFILRTDSYHKLYCLPPSQCNIFPECSALKRKKARKLSQPQKTNWAPGPRPLPSWAPPLQSHPSPRPDPVPLVTPGVPGII